ncbi:MAG: hypothetical protein FWF97_03540 [Alphaproteobacteria bacterium]|nr:hypothetical protein [Alphaproteobacteria bacterium]
MRKLFAFAFAVIFALPAVGAERAASAARVSMAAARAPNMASGVPKPAGSATVVATPASTATTPAVVPAVAEPAAPVPQNSATCREEFRDCMDQFCLLDESEGGRCACSNTIENSKPKIKAINDIQAEAEKLFGEGVEKEKLGAKALLIFGTSEKASRSRIDLMAWLNSGTESGGGLDEDNEIGDYLHSMAMQGCAERLEACGKDANMEETLYSRMITADCKAFSTFLDGQKRAAEQNKAIAEKAVRTARLEMLDTTNKYNRGECLLAYRSCIADKGGCGANFENCLDPSLLQRRASACENILDQCMASKKYVLDDWKAESEMILAEAAKYADKFKRQNCMAKIQMCLEDGCSKATDSTCLTNVNVAAGICPIINECDTIIPGIRASMNDKLAFLSIQFCQNDIDKCLQSKCGEDFTKPECLGQTTAHIMSMCPQSMFPSCKSQDSKTFSTISNAAIMQIDYQMLTGCANYFTEQLGRICGTDMACLPLDENIATLTESPKDAAALLTLRNKVRENARAEVAKLFETLRKESTIGACADAKKPAGRASMGDSIFQSTRMLAEISAENRALRELESKQIELVRNADLETKRKKCEEELYKPETRPNIQPISLKGKNKSEIADIVARNNFTFIKTSSFEPSLSNCHVCRVQVITEVGGEGEWTSALKGMGGGLAGGVGAGTMLGGWGALAGGVVGAAGGVAMGYASGGRELFPQEVEVCEDVNM